MKLQSLKTYRTFILQSCLLINLTLASNFRSTEDTRNLAQRTEEDTHQRKEMNNRVSENNFLQAIHHRENDIIAAPSIDRDLELAYNGKNVENVFGILYKHKASSNGVDDPEHRLPFNYKNMKNSFNAKTPNNMKHVNSKTAAYMSSNRIKQGVYQRDPFSKFANRFHSFYQSTNIFQHGHPFHQSKDTVHSFQKLIKSFQGGNHLQQSTDTIQNKMEPSKSLIRIQRSSPEGNPGQQSTETFQKGNIHQKSTDIFDSFSQIMNNFEQETPFQESTDTFQTFQQLIDSIQQKNPTDTFQESMDPLEQENLSDQLSQEPTETLEGNILQNEMHKTFSNIIVSGFDPFQEIETNEHLSANNNSNDVSFQVGSLLPHSTLISSLINNNNGGRTGDATQVFQLKGINANSSENHDLNKVFFQVGSLPQPIKTNLGSDVFQIGSLLPHSTLISSLIDKNNNEGSEVFTRMFLPEANSTKNISLEIKTTFQKTYSEYTTSLNEQISSSSTNQIIENYFNIVNQGQQQTHYTKSESNSMMYNRLCISSNVDLRAEAEIFIKKIYSSITVNKNASHGKETSAYQETIEEFILYVQYTKAKTHVTERILNALLLIISGFGSFHMKLKHDSGNVNLLESYEVKYLEGFFDLYISAIVDSRNVMSNYSGNNDWNKNIDHKECLLNISSAEKACSILSKLFFEKSISNEDIRNDYVSEKYLQCSNDLEELKTQMDDCEIFLLIPNQLMNINNFLEIAERAWNKITNNKIICKIQSPKCLEEIIIDEILSNQIDSALDELVYNSEEYTANLNYNNVILNEEKLYSIIKGVYNINDTKFPNILSFVIGLPDIEMRINGMFYLYQLLNNTNSNRSESLLLFDCLQLDLNKKIINSYKDFSESLLNKTRILNTELTQIVESVIPSWMFKIERENDRSDLHEYLKKSQLIENERKTRIPILLKLVQFLYHYLNAKNQNYDVIERFNNDFLFKGNKDFGIDSMITSKEYGFEAALEMMLNTTNRLFVSRKMIHVVDVLRTRFKDYEGKTNDYKRLKGKIPQPIWNLIFNRQCSIKNTKTDMYLHVGKLYFKNNGEKQALAQELHATFTSTLNEADGEKFLWKFIYKEVDDTFIIQEYMKNSSLNINRYQRSGINKYTVVVKETNIEDSGIWKVETIYNEVDIKFTIRLDTTEDNHVYISSGRDNYALYTANNKTINPVFCLPMNENLLTNSNGEIWDIDCRV